MVGYASPGQTMNIYPTRDRPSKQMADTIQNAVFPVQMDD